MLADPRLEVLRAELAAALRRQREDPAAQARLPTMLGTYADARSAAADLFNNALLAGAGAAVFQKLTPGTFTLGPALAAAIAHLAGVASVPLGAAAGGLWYAWFPVQPSAGLLLGTTGGLMLAVAVSAVFAGVASDPLLRALGLHECRLHRLIDALGRELEGDSEAAFQVRGHYVARIFDLLDLARASARSLTG